MPEFLHLLSPTPDLGQYDLQEETAGKCVLSYTVYSEKHSVPFFSKINKNNNNKNQTNTTKW